MAKFSDSIGTFQTGDLVFVRYPPRGTQPIHVTVFLDASAAKGAGYLHAGDKTLELSSLASYAEYKELGGYLHAHTANADLRQAVANVAATFTFDAARPTPYGHYPNKDLIAKVAGKAVESPRANRFGGMIGTRDVGEIPFDFPALNRLLKWTYRAIVKAPLSQNRGITCAAFAAACHQVAGMCSFMSDVGVTYKPELLRDAVAMLDKLAVRKDELRAKLELIGVDPANHRPIFKGQALRENSNRVLSKDGKALLNDKLFAKKTVEKEGEATEIVVLQPWADEARKAMGAKLTDLTPVERIWLYVQAELLKVSPYQMRLLSRIVDPAFFFDAKYVSSPALEKALRAAGGWKTTEYTEY